MFWFVVVIIGIIFFVVMISRPLRNRVLHRLFWLIASNNGRCVLLWLLTFVVLVLCLIKGHGEPILSRSLDSNIQRMQSQYHQGVYDTWNRFEALRRQAAGESIPRPRRQPSVFWSWVHWRVFGWLLFFAIIYTPIAFREEVHDALEIVLRRRREAEARVTPATTSTPTSATPSTTGGIRDRFWYLFRIDLLAEFVWEAIENIFRAIFRGGRR